ncbi:MAG: C25 family cysteine peptidase [bacterium]
MMHTKRRFLLVCFFSLLSLRAAAKEGDPSIFVVEERSADRIVFALRPFEIDVRRLKTEGGAYDEINVPQYGVSTEPGLPMLPESAVLVVLPQGVSVTASVLTREFEDIPDVNVLPAPVFADDGPAPDAPALYLENERVYASRAFWPTHLVEVGETGVLRGQRVARIIIRPVQYNPGLQTLRVFRKLRVLVRFSRPVLSKPASQPGARRDFFAALNRSAFITDPPFDRTGFKQPAGRRLLQDDDWYNPQFDYTKLAVEEDGLVAVTYDELAQAGVAVDMLELSTLKLLNKGQQIPLWIEGPAASRFGPEHTVYFYGRRNSSTAAYFDFYSDTNIYWLTSGGEAGMRYKLQEQQSGAAAVSDFYWQRLHLEQDNLMHRSNGSSVIDQDEGWIWRTFFEDERGTFDFDLDAIYEPAATCTLRVRLNGTTRDPVDPDHHVRVTLNGTVVAEAFFDDREAYLLNQELSTSLLLPGRNRLEIHLLPGSGATVNQIYLDWFELIYARRHVATPQGLAFEQPGTAGLPTAVNLRNFREAEVVVFQPDRAKMWQPQAERRSFLSVESAGFDDGKFVRFQIDFVPYLFNSRGHHLAVLDAQTGAPEFHRFDTNLSSQEAEAMAEFINSLPAGTRVMAGIVDEGTASMTESAYQALESLGSGLAREVAWRDSWALIGQKGAASGSVPEALSRRLSGPVTVRDTLRDEAAWRYSVTFQDTSLAPAFYFAAGKSQAKKVVAITPDQSSILRDPNQGADYLIISHRNFLPAAQRLADYRRQHDGFRCQAVDVQDVYDEFNFGIEHPRAIKAFVEFTSSNWQVPGPTFLLLFGDATWDPKQLLPEASKRNFVTSYGILVSDNWYAALDGPDDLLPDLFVGRIPVETPEQAELVVDKIIFYESQPFAPWSKEFLFLNGGITSAEQRIFLSQADTLIANYLDWPSFQGKAFSFNKTGNEGITQALRRKVGDRIAEGTIWVNFLGHAGSAIWDIDIGNPDEWQNTIFPFMTGMSCHSARFANPFANSLSEIYFIHPNGAAAYWGSSGFGYITQDFFLLHGLYKAVARDTVRRVGAATTAAKIHLWQVLGDQIRSRYVIDQYTLVGDPALRLNLPDQPELAVQAGEITFDSDFLLIADSTTTLAAKIRNYGLVPQDSIDVRFSFSGAGLASTRIDEVRVAPFGTTDSLFVAWDIPGQPGSYTVEVHLDPQNEIFEQDESNNSAAAGIAVFTSDLTLIKPSDFAVIKSSQPMLVTTNSRALDGDLGYFFEVDTSASFDSPVVEQSPRVEPGKLVTAWQTALPAVGVYFWRVRTFDGENFGPWASSSFLYDSSFSFEWQQGHASQFEKNDRDDQLGPAAGHEIALRRNLIVYEAESGGFSDGNFAFLRRNGEFFGPNRRGHNVAVFDETDGAFLTAEVFDTFVDAGNAEALAQLIDDLPDGRIVVVAIRDEGTVSMTESAYLALEGLGSGLTRQVGFRNSWALIGHKGAAIGSAKEAVHSVGEGPVAVVDSVYRFARAGRMVSTQIGPVGDWGSARFDYTASGQNEQIEFRVLGRRRNSAASDTLLSAAIGAAQVDLSGVDARQYPRIQLEARFISEDGLTTPRLRSWAVDFTPPPDLVAGAESFETGRDTVQAGVDIDLTLSVGNFGLTDSDSFSVRIVADRERANKEVVAAFRTEGIAVDNLATYTALLQTQDLLGKVRVRAQIDADDEIAEINENNNSVSTEVWVVRDTLSPDIRVTFDGREVVADEFVGANPEIVVEIRDQGALTLTDTGRVSIFLDERKVKYGSGSGEAQFLPQQSQADPALKALALFHPSLSHGPHQIEVVAKDASNNLQYFRTEFAVSERFVLANVMNFPNPFRRSTSFTYLLTQEADRVQIKIYTVSGRLILVLDAVPGEVGYNQVPWDGRDRDGDSLANGVYLYKVIATRGGEQSEAVEKLVVMR